MTRSSSYPTQHCLDPMWDEWLGAVEQQNIETLSHMIECGMVEAHHYWPALQLAIAQELPQSIAFLAARATHEDIHAGLWRAGNDGKTTSLNVLLQSERVNPNHQGAQALLGAILAGHDDCVRLLMKGVNRVHFGTAFYEALYCQNEELARLFYPHCDPQKQFQHLHQYFSEIYQGDTALIDEARAIMAMLEAEMLHKEVPEAPTMNVGGQMRAKALKL